MVSKGQAITPPIWHGSSMMVLRRAPGSIACGAAFVLSMSRAPTRPSVSTMAFLCSTSLCPHCSRPRWCDVQVMPTGVGFLRTAVCMGAFNGSTFLTRHLAARSDVWVEGLHLGRVVPLLMVASYSCEGKISSVPPRHSGDWHRFFRSRVEPVASVSTGLRVLTLNCGGAGDKTHLVVGLILSQDPGVVFLQELWDADFSPEVSLRMYVFCLGSVRGAGRGLCILLHRRLWPVSLTPSYDAIYDDRSCFLIMVELSESVVVLLGDIHLDPELNSTEKEAVLAALGTFIRKIGPHFVIVAGDFNVHRTEFSLVSRMIRPGHILSGLSIPYPPREKPNYVRQSNGSWTSEIDYVLVSSGLQLEFKALFPGVCSHMAVVCDFQGMASSSGQYSKRYKHRSTTPDMRLCLSAHLGLFWWWMSKLDVHPDEWVYCY